MSESITILSEKPAPQATPSAKLPRRGPKPSAETIRKRVTFLIGSGNLRELDEAGYVVVPRDLLSDAAAALADFVPAQASNGSGDVAQ